MKNIANTSLVEEVKYRLNNVNIDSLKKLYEIYEKFMKKEEIIW